MRKLRILAVTAFVLLFSTVDLRSQTTVDSARNAALNFFKTYDSIPYLTFDVKYTLFSDTLYSDFSYEVMKGTYTMSGKKARYSLGDVEYLQNDSFLVAVYHKDLQIILSEPPTKNAGSYLPMREMLDSLLQAHSANYDFWIKTTTVDPETDNLGYIKMVRKQNNYAGIYNKYIIEFDLMHNTISKVEYEYNEPGLGLTSQEEPDAGQRMLKNASRRKTLRIEFLNYRFDNFSDDVYSENNMVWEEDGVYRPVELYKNYKVFNARN